MTSNGDTPIASPLDESTDSSEGGEELLTGEEIAGLRAGIAVWLDSQAALVMERTDEGEVAPIEDIRAMTLIAGAVEAMARTEREW